MILFCSSLLNAFKTNDFTAKVPLKRKHNIIGENARVFMKAKKFFGKYPLGNNTGDGLDDGLDNGFDDSGDGFDDNSF